MSYESKKSALLAKHRQELDKLEKEEGVGAAFIAAGLPVPDFICVHDGHASVSWKGSGYPADIPVADAIAKLRLLEPMVVPMEPAMKDGLFRSLYPVCARGKGEYVSDGVEFAVELRQYAFGEQAKSNAPRYIERRLGMWAKVGDKMVHMEIPVCYLSSGLNVYHSGHSRQMVKPGIPGSKMYAFHPGGEVGCDVHYMFASLDDLEAALIGEKVSA